MTRDMFLKVEQVATELIHAAKRGEIETIPLPILKRTKLGWFRRPLISFERGEVIPIGDDRWLLVTDDDKLAFASAVYSFTGRHQGEYQRQSFEDYYSWLAATAGPMKFKLLQKELDNFRRILASRATAV